MENDYEKIYNYFINYLPIIIYGCLKDYWIPRSGANYSGDIRAKFPGAAADDALNIEKYAEALTNDSWSQATAYLNSLQNNN